MEKLKSVSKRDVFLSLILIVNVLLSANLSATTNILMDNQDSLVENQAIISDQVAGLGDNQVIIAEQMDVLAENEMAIASHLDALTDYVGKISGEMLETEVTEVDFDIHVEMLHHRDGVLIGYSHHAGVLTTQGAEYIEQALGNNASTLLVTWIGLSNDGTAPSSAWSVIPAEITTGAMGRADGTYSSLGTGNWRIQNVFSPSGSGTFQLVGLHWSLYPEATLMASDQVTSTSYENGDTVTINFDITIS